MHVDHAVIQFIIEERTKQLAGYLVRMLKDMGVRLEEKPPVYITGGGIALMRGSCEYTGKAHGCAFKGKNAVDAQTFLPKLRQRFFGNGFRDAC